MAANKRPGNILWKSSKRRWEDSSPTVIGDTVIAGSKSGIYAFNVADGTRRWQLQTDGAATTAPMVVDGTVYMADTSGSIYRESRQSASGLDPEGECRKLH